MNDVALGFIISLTLQQKTIEAIAIGEHWLELVFRGTVSDFAPCAELFKCPLGERSTPVAESLAEHKLTALDLWFWLEECSFSD